MKKNFAPYLFLIVLFLLTGLRAQESTPAQNRQPVPYETISYDPASPETMQWWEDGKFGLFIHWGLYSVPGGLWSKDKTFESWREGKPENLYCPAHYAEQILKDSQMPISEYKKLLPLFDWSKFNAQALVNLCFASGQRYIVFTSKHCDGFANWNTKVNDWNICQTPYGRQSGRDPLKELADACHATKTNGSPWEVKLCLYYTHCINWNEPDAFPYDYTLVKQPTAEGFKNYLNRIVKPHLTELLTQYGSIGMIWFDAPRMITAQEAQELKDLVNKLSPETIIDGRLGHELGNYSNTGDNGTVGVPLTAPWETGSSLNESYGYMINAKDYKTSEEVILKLIQVVSHGGNYLLNIGPKGDGTIADKDKQILTEVGKWTKANGDAIFGTRRSPFTGDHAFLPDWGEFTQKGGNLYLLVTHWPKDGKLSVPLVQNEIKKIYFVADAEKKPLPYTRSKDANGNDTIVINVPAASPQKVATAIAVECEGGQLELAAFKHAYDPAKQQIYLAAANFQAYAPNLKALSLYYDGAKQAVVNWKQDKGGGGGPTIAWTFDAPEAGTYEVEINYAANKRSAGLSVAVSIDHQQQLTFTTQITGADNVCKKILVGAVRLAKGKQDIALALDKSDGNKLFVMQQLKGIYLTKK